MLIPPERESLDCSLHVVIPASLEEAIDAFAREHKVKKSIAVRFMLATFLSDYFRKTKENHEQIEAMA